MAWMLRSPYRLALLGAVLVAMVAGLAAFLLLTDGKAGDAGDTLESYAFEATVEAEGDDDVLGTIRAWYSAPEQWRFEFGDFSNGPPREGTLMLSDGETVWTYDAATNTYTTLHIEGYYQGVPEELRGPRMLPTFSLIIGPMPGGEDGDYLENLTSDWSMEERADGGLVAGRPSEVVTYTHDAGTLTLWLDREYPFSLRYDSKSGARRIQAEVTDVAFNQPIDGTVFRFDPPVGAAEVEPGSGSSSSSGSISSSGSEIGAPTGFYEPEYLPEGYMLAGAESSASPNGATTRFVAHLESPDGGRLDIEQQYRAGGLSESQQSGLAVAVSSTTGYLETDGDTTTFTWSKGDIVIGLVSDRLTDMELLTLAEAMRLNE